MQAILPSEYTINVQDFPDQPTYALHSRSTIREALRAQTDVRWTLVCNGWFMDYLLRPPQCGLTDLARGWCTNNDAKVFDLYGDGLQEVSLASVRDTARAVLALLEGDVDQWTDFTFLSAQTLTYVELYELLKSRDPSWIVRKVSFTEVLNAVSQDDGKGNNVVDFLRVMGFTNCNNMPEHQTLKWGKDEAEAHKDVIP
ncbi:hypothetical protein LTR41_010956 [Exophiala xenobiotica]|nr:hypothetical protein LTR41_010956 [Exophiala xenobiotica]KAK5551124.1 hypothetical protein LTR46_010877 [Exophiala xenobiotica]